MRQKTDTHCLSHISHFSRSCNPHHRHTHHTQQHRWQSNLNKATPVVYIVFRAWPVQEVCPSLKTYDPAVGAPLPVERIHHSGCRHLCACRVCRLQFECCGLIEGYKDWGSFIPASCNCQYPGKCVSNPFLYKQSRSSEDDSSGCVVRSSCRVFGK